MKENLKAQFEAIINEQSGEAILNKFYRKDVIKAMQRAYELALKDKWISVKDDEDMTMPPFEEKTLIICEDGQSYTGYFNGADNHGYVWFCDNNDYHYPTHWQPIEPPVTL